MTSILKNPEMDRTEESGPVTRCDVKLPEDSVYPIGLLDWAAS